MNYEKIIGKVGMLHAECLVFVECVSVDSNGMGKFKALENVFIIGKGSVENYIFNGWHIGRFKEKNIAKDTYRKEAIRVDKEFKKRGI
jgi:hypothetical protein